MVLDLVTHKENSISGDMERLDDPEVIYRDLISATEHVNGKTQAVHRRYSMKLSEWNLVIDGKQRFKMI